MEEASVTIRFDLTSFADKMYRWREASERRNTVSVGFFTEQSVRFFKLTSLV
jgi:hypothetical protein